MESEEDDDEDEGTKSDEKMEKGTKGPLSFDISDETDAKRPNTAGDPTRDDILGVRS